MKSTTDKPVDHERAAELKAEARAAVHGEAVWRSLVGLASPETVEILDRLERKTIEAERNRAECLRLEGEMDSAQVERDKADETANSYRTSRETFRVENGRLAALARSARAKLALGLEAFDRADHPGAIPALLDAVRAAAAELDGVAS